LSIVEIVLRPCIFPFVPLDSTIRMQMLAVLSKDDIVSPEVVSHPLGWESITASVAIILRRLYVRCIAPPRKLLTVRRERLKSWLVESGNEKVVEDIQGLMRRLDSTISQSSAAISAATKTVITDVVFRAKFPIETPLSSEAISEYLEWCERALFDVTALDRVKSALSDCASSLATVTGQSPGEHQEAGEESYDWDSQDECRHYR
jgi:hypothetical protein